MLDFITGILEQASTLFLGRPTRAHKYAAGEIVRVRDRETISESIRPHSKKDGCLFMDQMWDYCGGNYSVAKVVSIYYNERRGRRFRPRSPLYVLKGLTCEGRVSHFPFRCDHGCPILWHEDWLDKS
jgi:hypothetical protein